MLLFGSCLFRLATVFYCCLFRLRLPICNCLLMLPLPGRFPFLCVSAYFYRNPFAFANVPPLPTGFCFRLESGFRLPLFSLPAGSCRRRARAASFLKKFNTKNTLNFLKNSKSNIIRSFLISTIHYRFHLIFHSLLPRFQNLLISDCLFFFHSELYSDLFKIYSDFILYFRFYRRKQIWDYLIPK
ncbi:hypothetical protein MmiHf6_17540 [Methanimicrococcus hongohii]|uniref:Uncharacterized protein n=1 Tax=Methanimicrococcus hongohii TaxID=3028295 RepID=A0AA96V1X6_9EURY|nr:hypothetical protein MmiHf6_17540 [Methanimicrococcus sp. Hf6]